MGKLVTRKKGRKPLTPDFGKAPSLPIEIAEAKPYLLADKLKEALATQTEPYYIRHPEVMDGSES